MKQIIELNSLMDKMPFKRTLSLIPLLNLLKKNAKNLSSPSDIYSNQIVKEIEKISELNKPIYDMSLLKKYSKELKILFSSIIPDTLQDSSIITIHPPFNFMPFYNTNKYKTLIDDNIEVSFSTKMDMDTFLSFKLVYAYANILKLYYNVNIDFCDHMVIKVFNKSNGLEQYYQLNYNFQFIDIINHGPEIKLDESQKNYIIKNINNPELLFDILPLENFDFQGFVYITYTNVTEREIISLLKSDLIEKDTVFSINGFKSLQQKIRTILKLPDINLGLIGLCSDKKNRCNNVWTTILKSCNLDCEFFKASIYEQAIRTRQTVIIDNISSITEPGPIEKEIMQENIMNIAVTPLFYDEQLIGILELGSPNKNQINHINIKSLYEIFPIFSIAVKRVTEELDNKIQATIKEKCTAIHPTVEWKFVDAVSNLLDRQKHSEIAEIEDIIFEDVYPLYGASDIRNSSLERNKAIQSDLLKHLELARFVLINAFNIQKMPIIDYLIIKIDEYCKNVNIGLKSGDEVSVLEFIKQRVEPVFDFFYRNIPEMKKFVSDYRNELSPDLGIYYRQRKLFEESVTTINDTISSFIDKQEEESQKMYPHYFEKYKTDGVEYNIYIGDSLVIDKSFNLIHLQNLRLWQLILMCEIDRLSKKLKSKIAIPLDTTQLILAHNAHLSIRFRFDEKQFDVDGTYNVRYEIIKKRIDKSVIKGTKERLTQPGKVAIIYTQDKEKLEYEKYIEYILKKAFISDKIEFFELEDLQGVHGLKAIRIEVKHI